MKPGATDLQIAIARCRGLFGWTFVFSIFVNLLMLTGPLFMLQVYDRVLGSGSEETLVALVILIAALFFLMGLLDFARGRLLARIGARYQSQLDPVAFSIALGARKTSTKGAGTVLSDVETVQQFYSSPVFLAFFDLPWSPFFLAAIFVFHPWLGWFALGGGALLVVIALTNQLITRNMTQGAQAASHAARGFSNQAQTGAAILKAQGMQAPMLSRWLAHRDAALGKTIGSSDWTGAFASLTKTLRMFLQSAILGLGAYLTLQGEMTGGAMIAASILMGRALAPIEQSITQWAFLQRARQAWSNIKTVLGGVEPAKTPTQLPRPAACLELRDATVMAPDREDPILSQVGLKLEPGSALGVIGSSGSGKSTLAKVIMGITPTMRGDVRLGQATLQQYGPEAYADHVGYLPQDIVLFDGTIGENIARMALEPEDDKVVAAAKKANAHGMILALPQGYDTPLLQSKMLLSGGQQQRIALARALYSDPVLLVLDEPNSALDAEGSAALNRTIRQFKGDGRAIILMTHRPTAISECDMILILKNGRVDAFGPRDEVLKSALRNTRQVQNTLKEATP
ncbi:MAG: type I secretion system permease/ATPase [Paracoccaceae bacterium]